jgi:hypothetical protein
VALRNHIHSVMAWLPAVADGVSAKQDSRKGGEDVVLGNGA